MPGCGSGLPRSSLSSEPQDSGGRDEARSGRPASTAETLNVEDLTTDQSANPEHGDMARMCGVWTRFTSMIAALFLVLLALLSCSYYHRWPAEYGRCTPAAARTIVGRAVGRAGKVRNRSPA
jgi:hypothetical protein